MTWSFDTHDYSEGKPPSFSAICDSSQSVLSLGDLGEFQHSRSVTNRDVDWLDMIHDVLIEEESPVLGRSLIVFMSPSNFLYLKKKNLQGPMKLYIEYIEHNFCAYLHVCLNLHCLEWICPYLHQLRSTGFVGSHATSKICFYDSPSSDESTLSASLVRISQLNFGALSNQSFTNLIVPKQDFIYLMFICIGASI